MVFVVYTCAKCGKGTYTEVRDQSKITKKTFKCNRCGKSSSYSKTKIHRIVEHVTDAMNIARRADLNHNQDLSIDEKRQYATYGEQFMQREGEKKRNEDLETSLAVEFRSLQRSRCK